MKTRLNLYHIPYHYIHGWEEKSISKELNHPFLRHIIMCLYLIYTRSNFSIEPFIINTTRYINFPFRYIFQPIENARVSLAKHDYYLHFQYPRFRISADQTSPNSLQSYSTRTRFLWNNKEAKKSTENIPVDRTCSAHLSPGLERKKAGTTVSGRDPFPFAN